MIGLRKLENAWWIPLWALPTSLLRAVGALRVGSVPLDRAEHMRAEIALGAGSALMELFILEAATMLAELVLVVVMVPAMALGLSSVVGIGPLVLAR